MDRRRGRRGSGVVIRAGLCVLLTGLGGVAVAQTVPANGIFTCVDERGRRITSDRPIPQCLDREQALRNRDGSVRKVIGPSMTAEERAAHDEAQRQRLAKESARRDEVRKDRNLLARYPDAQAHDRARATALQPVRDTLRVAGMRAEELRKEAVQLSNDAEFYKGRSLPSKLVARTEANRSAQQAQAVVIRQHQVEEERLNRRYDEEFTVLQGLWAGAPLGHRAGKSAAQREN